MDRESQPMAAAESVVDVGRRAVVVGATGLVGRACLHELAGNRAFTHVTSVARRPMDRVAPSHEHVVADFDAADGLTGLLAADDLFLCLGTTIAKVGSREAFRAIDHDLSLKIATLAVREGCTQLLLVSALGADPDSRIFYNRVKGELEQDVRKLGYDSVSIFRPSLLAGSREEVRRGERVGLAVAHAVGPLMIGPLRRYRAVPAADVARVMVRVAERDSTGVTVYESGVIAKLAHA